MFEKYTPVLTGLLEYLSFFRKSGFDRERAGKIAGMLNDDINDTPLNDIFELFGAKNIEKCAVLLGYLVNFSSRAAGMVSRLFDTQPGCISPGAICELFLGVSDIFPACDIFYRHSMLDRLFDGTAPRFNSCMSLKSFAAGFINDGILDDEMFLPEGEPAEETEFLIIQGIKTAETEIISVLAGGASSPEVIFVRGEEGSGRKTAAVRAVQALGNGHIFIRADSACSSERIRDIALKLRLLGCVPIVSQGSEPDKFADMLADSFGTVICICPMSLTDPKINSDHIIINIEPVRSEEQFIIWNDVISRCKTDGTVSVAELAGEFPLTVGAAKKAVSFALMLSGKETLSAPDIKKGCVRSLSSDMGSKAVKLYPVFGWDDIVLPEHSKQLLKTACDQVRYRHRVYDTWGFSEKIAYGRSVSMIFTGPPGTGKTMAAQIIAAELGLDIYRISLANVVSKYIGETEKNLDEIFDKARKSKVVLFFDEADVLFSKRTEVKDANDKYSNMEAAFLLQKIEEYNGIVILATNLVQNFDEAFKRRMKMMIDFPFPDKERRREMWTRAFPEKMPLEDLDWDYLVNNFELSGSNIKNIALHSAFLAAAENSGRIGMKHVIAAVKNEYSKSGKAFTKAEAGEYFYYIDE